MTYFTKCLWYFLAVIIFIIFIPTLFYYYYSSSTCTQSAMRRFYGPQYDDRNPSTLFTIISNELSPIMPNLSGCKEFEFCIGLCSHEVISELYANFIASTLKLQPIYFCSCVKISFFEFYHYAELSSTGVIHGRAFGEYHNFLNVCVFWSWRQIL